MSHTRTVICAAAATGVLGALLVIPSGAASAGADGRASTGPWPGARLGPVAAPAGGAGTTSLTARAPASLTRSATAVTYDDRALARSAGWRSVASSKASKRTLSCSTRVGATLTLRTAAKAGGALVVQTGARRGSVEVKVAGKRKVLSGTAAARVAAKTIAFAGAGAVVVRVVTPGRAGVCVDAVRLNPAPAASPLLRGALRQVNLSSTGAGADAEILNAEVSPGGTMIAFWSNATNLYPGATSGKHLYVASMSTGRVLGVLDTTAGNELSNDGDSGSGSRPLSWAPVEEGQTDSRFVAFGAAATNLGTTPTNGFAPYAFVKNVQDWSVTVLPITDVGELAWSPDGNLIAFRTETGYGTDLNNDPDVWALDLRVDPNQANLWCVSCDASGNLPTTTGGPTESYQIGWAPDSSRVAFNTYAKNLIGNDTNVSRDVYVKNIYTSAITRVSTGTGGTQGNSYSEGGTFSPDGSKVAFASSADNLVPGDTNSSLDVFVKNLSTGGTTIVSRTSAGLPALFDSYRPHWSPDGGRIAFMSRAVDLMPRPFLDSNGTTDVYIATLATGLKQIVSYTPDGRFGSNWSSLFEIGGYKNNAWLPNGKSLVFASDSPNLAATDGNAFGRDLFLKSL